MRWEVSMLPVNDYRPEELIREEIPEKYLFDDAHAFVLATTFFNSEDTVHQLIHFLFQTGEIPREPYRDAENYVLDLSSIKNRLIELGELESLYPNWLRMTGRENTMDEYGMLTDFIEFGHTENRCH